MDVSPTTVKQAAVATLGTKGSLGALSITAGTIVYGVSLWKEFFGTKDAYDTTSVIQPIPTAIAGGGVLMALAGRTEVASAAAGVPAKIAGSEFVRKMMMGGGAGLALAGVGALLAPPVARMFHRDAAGQQLSQPDPDFLPPSKYPTFVPRTPADLAGMTVAIGSVVKKDHSTARPVISLDVPTSVQLPTGTTAEQAIGKARAYVQKDDPSYRGYAVVRTSDDRFWVTRLKGDLDQVDGVQFATGNDYQPYLHAHIDRVDPSIVAIAGVTGFWDLRDDPGLVDEQGYESIPHYSPDIPLPSATPKPDGTPSSTPSAGGSQ